MQAILVTSNLSCQEIKVYEVGKGLVRISKIE